MPDPIIEYDQDSEELRVQLLDYINSKGTKQNFISKKINLSNASLSLFLSKRRILVPEKQELIRQFINGEL